MPKVTGSLPRWLPLLNKVMTVAQRLGLSVGPVQVLVVPGRTTGTPRETPVTPFAVDGRWYVAAALPDADWARNIRAAGRGELRRGRSVRAVSLPEVHDLALKRDVMRAFPTAAPGGVSFYVRLGLVTGPDPEQFAAVADRVAVFAIHPA
ncbi:MAG TPA: nitroreductase/quinone reductase family protein [Pseudonocardia sp.]